MPKETHLRCRLQEPHGRLATTFVQRRLTKRNLLDEFFSEVCMQHPAWSFLDRSRRGYHDLITDATPPLHLGVVHNYAGSSMPTSPQRPIPTACDVMENANAHNALVETCGERGEPGLSKGVSG